MIESVPDIDRERKRLRLTWAALTRACELPYQRLYMGRSLTPEELHRVDVALCGFEAEMKATRRSGSRGQKEIAADAPATTSESA